MMDGPGAPGTWRCTCVVVPARTASMNNAPEAPLVTRETQRTLLLTSFEGGANSFAPNRMAAMLPLVLSTCGTAGSGSEKPSRAQVGNTPVRTSDEQLDTAGVT